MPDDIRQIELRRLHELEKQAALHGPNTEPEILIEIQELHTRYPGTPRNGHRRGAPDRTAAQSELDFVMNTIAAALSRITKMEFGQAERDVKLDQLLYGVRDLRRWVQIGGVGLVVALILGFVLAVVVF